jgi:hypothetical protein
VEAVAVAVHRTLLGVLMEGRDRSQEEEVTAFNATARRLNERDAALSVRTLRRWINGDIATRPRAPQCRVALAHWGHPIDELLAPARSGDVSMEGAADNDAGALMTIERQVTMASKRASQFIAAAEGGIGPGTLEQLRDDVTALATSYLSQPVTALLAPLAETQEAVFSQLEARQRPDRAADLYLLAGVVSALLAKVSQDLGRPRDAMTQARTAYVCADNAGHPGLRAWSRGLQSLITYWGGRPGDGARYARLGADELGSGAGSVAAWLPCLEARAWALVGNSGEAVAAVERAQDARAAHASDDLDEIGGLFSFSTAKQRYYAAGTFVHLDNGASRACEEATEALQLYDAGVDPSYSDAAGTRAELALSRVIATEVEGAGEALAPVLELAPERRITGIVASTGRVELALRAPAVATSPAARAIRGEIEAFSRVPAAELAR